MKSVTLGQYYPADSFIHKLDGRTKIMIATAMIISVFLCKSLSSFAFLLALTVFSVIISRIPFRIVFSSLKAVSFILVFTFIFNVFLTSSDTEPIIDWWIFTIYEDGLWTALFVSLRILCLILTSSIFISFTTTPIQLTYAIESLLKPLGRIGVPVHDFAMMMSIVLRFIPALSEETEKIMTAQKSRGADFTNGNLLKRARALIPILVPLFVSAFRRSDELATAMECRCYHGGNGRTRMTVTYMKARDYFALAMYVVFIVCLIALNFIDFGFSL